MGDNVINQGGDGLVWTVKGFLKTVVRAATTPFAVQDTFQLKKAVDVDFDLSPAFELRFDDDGRFDVVPTGDVGTWTTRLPLTSDVVSTKTGKTIAAGGGGITNADRNTLNYWFHELIGKKFPPIEFDDEMATNEATPKQINLGFKGYLTGFRKIRTETEGVFDLELSGIIRQDTAAEIAANVDAGIIKTTP